MKKSVLTVILGLLISVSAMAQSKIDAKATKAVEKVATAIELSNSEKATYLELVKAKLEGRASFPKGLKESNPDEFKAKSKANRKEFTKNVIKAFGEARGNEILDATKKKGKGKKKNK